MSRRSRREGRCTEYSSLLADSLVGGTSVSVGWLGMIRASAVATTSAVPRSDSRRRRKTAGRNSRRTVSHSPPYAEYVARISELGASTEASEAALLVAHAHTRYLGEPSPTPRYPNPPSPTPRYPNPPSPTPRYPNPPSPKPATWASPSPLNSGSRRAVHGLRTRAFERERERGREGERERERERERESHEGAM